MSERFLRPYKKTLDYSYASGAFCCYELLNARRNDVRVVYIHSDYNDDGNLERLCDTLSVKVIRDDKAFRITGQKENCLVFAVFSKYTQKLEPEAPHLCLVNPSDMGNLGTIIRTMAGFGVLSLALITPAADVFDPKTIRASMGAVFRVNTCLFGSFEEYINAFQNHSRYLFMTDGDITLDADVTLKSLKYPYTLVFGNESSGLEAGFKDMGTSVKIPQTGLIDSLNLSVSAGIGLFLFTSHMFTSCQNRS